MTAWQPVRRVLGRVRRAFVLDTFDVFRRGVTAADREFRDPDGYHFFLAGPRDVARCEERHTELDERERREGIARLAMGHACIAATPAAPAAGEPAPIVFSMWMNPRNLNIPRHVKRRLRPHQAFIYKAFTSPEHRGRKLYESGMRFALASLARDGKTELLGYAHTGKEVSRKGLAAVRFDSIGRFQRIGIGNACFVLVSKELAASLPEAIASSGRPADELAARLAEKPMERP